MIIYERPPNYDKIVKAGMNPTPTTIYAWGDDIYNPSGNELSEDVLVHEAEHAKQQREIGRDKWWGRYLVDPSFRVEQEVEAYRAQWKFGCKSTKNREAHNLMLLGVASLLSSEIYGSRVTFQEAVRLIKCEKKKNT